jgi:hypothetical protein
MQQEPSDMQNYLLFQCTLLNIALPGKVAFPNTPAYDLHDNYWSTRQSEITPFCFVAPANTGDVVKALSILRGASTPFTVKSGGHNAFPASNIERGVTIDLVNLKTLSLFPDQKTVSVGPGNRWIDVAHYLGPYQLAVVGGRVGDVGVSGLTLGGGISWFSGQYGWACDNVRNYEVVLPSGKVVNASPASYSDLYWALRGGGGPNFGIVTRFDLAIIQQGDIWYQEALYPATATNESLRLFSNLAVSGLPTDHKAHPALFAAYQPVLGGVVTQIFRWHATPPSPGTIPPVFTPLEALPAVPGTVKSATLSVADMLLVYPEPYGFRKGWWDTTVSATSPALLQQIAAAYGTWVETSLSGLPNVTAVLLVQPLSVNIMAQMQKNGGNPLGLHPSLGALMKILTYITWSDPALDVQIGLRATEFVAEIEGLARAAGLYNGFRYINNAELTQEVYRRYGVENYLRLKLVARKYDPLDVFKRLWKGYFKI